MFRHQLLIHAWKPYFAIWGGYGFYRGFCAENKFLYNKEDIEIDPNILYVDKLSNGITNSVLYLALPWIPFYRMLGRIELDFDQTKNKYSGDYYEYYREFTNRTMLPPRK